MITAWLPVSTSAPSPEPDNEKRRGGDGYTCVVINSEVLPLETWDYVVAWENIHARPRHALCFAFGHMLLARSFFVEFGRRIAIMIRRERRFFLSSIRI